MEPRSALFERRVVFVTGAAFLPVVHLSFYGDYP
jgi:hypothetical protein